MHILSFRLLSLVLLSLLLSGCGDGSDANRNAVAFDDCRLPAQDIVVNATEAGIAFVRTPDACFEALDGYNFAPNYVSVDGLRMHYVEAGPADGDVILMLHGQPSWSYLYRKMIPVLADAGYRVIAADHIGMGRSDKPVDPRVHVYDQQVRWNTAFIDALGLSDITLFVQDWGSLIGLRIAGENPALFARIVLANGELPAIPPGLNPFTLPVFEIDDSLPEAEEFFRNRSPERVEGFQQWIDYAAGAPYLFAADVVQFGTVIELSEAELAAYNAPFPDEIYRAAIRAFPSMVSGIQGQTLPALAALGDFDKPFLALAGRFDANLGSEATQNAWIERVPGARGQDHRRYDASHFIQEDVGRELAEQVVEFMRANPIPASGPFYNLRYCEILLVSSGDEGLEAQVYNTLGLNDCLQQQWDALDAGAVASEFGAIAAAKNGPRYWLLDLITPLDDGEPPPGFGEIETFGGLDMRLVAILSLAGGEAPENAPYTVIEVQRNTLFRFVAGRRIYELRDPEGGLYVMQSMSQIVDPQLQISDLATLDERLDLPPGWHFSTRILENDLQLEAAGLAEVLVDDLANTYQRVG
ncbi:MAG: haloalkane dehalogenase [Halioglobus sp.]